jgi:hypothetical protein
LQEWLRKEKLQLLIALEAAAHVSPGNSRATVRKLKNHTAAAA